MPLRPGEKLGPYEILEPIGKGGMGEVWKARDTRLDRIVAIKTSNQQFSERFEREARAVAALNHPNICTLHDVGPDYLVMEFVEGEALKGPLPLEEVLRVGRQITSALEAAHEKGITHRDLKPGNILMKPDGSVKVLDFGLAKITAPRAEVSNENSPTLTMAATQAGMILGTAAYMAPEQAKGKEVDKRADIWAFGVVLYELTTGSRAFQGGDMTEILASVIKEHPPYEPVPHELRRLLKKCLEKDPAKRLRDIGDVWELLEEPYAALQLRPSGRGFLWPAVAAVAALAAIVALWAPWREPAPTPQQVKFEVTPPEDQRLNQTNGAPAVSPDGRRVVFLVASSGQSRLWVRDLDSLQARMLPDTAGGSTPFWSHDGRQVAFGIAGKLVKIDIGGGPATTITNTTPLRGGDWNQDDVILFATQDTGLLRVSAAGGTPTPATELDKSRNETRHAYPQFLSDGRHFVYLALSSDVEKSGIFVGDLESKDKKLLFPATSNARYVEHLGQGHLLFVREGTLIAQPFDAGKLETTGDAVPVAERVDVPLGTYSYFGSSREGVLAYTTGTAGATVQMTWYNRAGKAVGMVGTPADIQNPRVSPNGKLLAVDRLDPRSGNRDIWLHDLERGTEQRLTFADSNHSPVWSPDNLRLAFSRRRGPSAAIVVKGVDGAGQEEEAENGGKRPTDWTRGFLISETPVGTSSQNDLWSLPIADGTKTGEPVLLRKTAFQEGDGRVSPDGRWVAYRSNASTRNEIYVMGFPGLSGPWQVSVDGGRLPVWSPNGRELFFASLDGRMMAVNIEPGDKFHAGVPKPLFNAPFAPNTTFDVSPEGRFLIPAPVAQTATVPITVVLNWQAQLKK